MTKRTRAMFTYVAIGALMYWWFWRKPSSAQTPEQIAYAKSLPSDLYL